MRFGYSRVISWTQTYSKGRPIIFAERDDVLGGFAVGFVDPAAHFVGGGVHDVAFDGFGDDVVGGYGEGTVLDDLHRAIRDKGGKLLRQEFWKYDMAPSAKGT